MNKREIILSYLKQHETMTLQQLSILLDSPPSSIRGRISELKKNHQIKTEYHPTRYSLFLTNPIIQYITENKLFGVSINIKNLSISLSLSLSETEKLLSKLFSNPSYHIFQQSSNNIIITKT